MHDSSPPPRRSQRDRKSVKPFNSSTKASARKRKRRDSDDEDVPHDTHPLSDDARDAGVDGEGEGDEVGRDEAEEEEEEYRIGPGRKGKGKATPKPKPGPAVPPVKKPRKTRTSKKARDGPEPDQLAKDTNIANDNALFSESPVSGSRPVSHTHTPSQMPSSIQPCHSNPPQRTLSTLYAKHRQLHKPNWSTSFSVVVAATTLSTQMQR